MFGWLFGNKAKAQSEPPDDTYSYGDELLFQWDRDSEGWTTDLGATETKAYVAPAGACYDPPLDSSCELIAQARLAIDDWQQSAVTLLANRLSGSDLFENKTLGSDDFRFDGLQIFEHEGRPDTCQLVFETDLDPEHLYRVDIRNGEAVDFGMEG